MRRERGERGGVREEEMPETNIEILFTAIGGRETDTDTYRQTNRHDHTVYCLHREHHSAIYC